MCFSTPHPQEQDVPHSHFFKRGFTGLNSEFSFSQMSCPIKLKALTPPYLQLID